MAVSADRLQLDGQRETAISTHEAGFTLLRDRISNTSVAMEIPEGTVEQLYARDLQLEHISKLALAPGDIHNVRNEITLANIACSDVPHFAPGIEVNARHYVEEQYTQGLYIGGDGREQGIEFHHRERTLASAAAAMPSDIPALPPMKEWVNVRTLGVKGTAAATTPQVFSRQSTSIACSTFPAGCTV